MRPTRDGGWQSDVAAPHFFLAATGQISPEDEYKATVDAFLMPYSGDPDWHPICRFPARADYMSRQRGVILPQVDCGKLAFWKNALAPNSLTLVHAAQYIRNPASVFGHLFLRVDQGAVGTDVLKLDTLAHSIGFFAQMPEDVNAFQYVVKGLGGGFQGRFIFSTYAKSLVEYNHMEDRDLWEYRLAVSRVERDQVLNHLWEMQQFGVFDYQFTLKNCAYQLLALLEAAVPRWDLTGRFDVYVIPSDALRILSDQGAFSKVEYRPSIGTKVRAAVKQMSSIQQNLLKDVVDGAVEPSLVVDKHVLNTTLDLIEYRAHQTKGVGQERLSRMKEAVLLRRSQLGSMPSFEVKRPSAQSFGHGPTRLSYGYVKRQEYEGLSLGWRPAMHNIVEGDGYPGGLTLELLDVKVVVDERTKKAQMDHLTILHVENLREFESVDRGFAWRLKFGWDRPIRNVDERSELIPRALGAMGLASSPHEPIQVWGLATLPLEESTSPRRTLLAAAGGSLGALVRLPLRITARFEAAKEWYLDPTRNIPYQVTSTLGCAPFRDLNLSAQWQMNGEVQVQEIEFRYYF